MLKVQKAANLHAKRSAFPHQLEALEAIKDLPFAAVFHEQGLGKTKIGLDLALSWLARDIVDSVLIITKKGLIKNWRTEVASHSHLAPRVLGQDRKRNFFAFNSPARLYLAHYEVVLSEHKRLELFLQTRRVGVLLDEAHKIKNPEAEVSEALHSLSDGFARRVIMTGTPVANRPYDLWSQVRFLDGGEALGHDFAAFKRALDLTNDLGQDKGRASVFADELEQLFQKIRPFSVRETKKTADLNLPDKTIRNLECVLEPRQAEIYAQFRDELAAVVVREGRPVLDDAEGMLKRLLRLVQVASNPTMVDQSYRAAPGKLPALDTLVHSAVDAGEKILVWTSFTENADFLGRHLDEFGVGVVHGGLSMAKREEALHAFKTDPECRVLVATPGAAKEGLTLTVANHAVFFDRTFSLDDYLQAQDRIHRISQEKPCFVTNLVATDTVDTWVDALLAAKHLAAQLGQGDISRGDYDARADYAFGEMVRDVLRLSGGDER
ncbi:DEAD/DEAH box helicase [Mesorhizobium sp. M7A.F.Ca.US.010.02.1.1]|uniref:DEAD/DEAH box helicase n=1 Tax=Mesorhizobium sp. M7A.F.Ca.US.010.02.1.1 TaxID=2496743 RepID=UPI000FD1F932|nr:DEAD/DEAH box helicase [Mesorhizobium sp. M7A.F.Ca.US.010.02.1.1]RUW94396.1 DEAD/DEAH box helicase [Mesorhizobium sp. M7A.F.Ca.US.010.02.1.1]